MRSEKPGTKVAVGLNGASKHVRVRLEGDDVVPWAPGAELKSVGVAAPRVDGPAKATGTARYTSDIALPGLLHAAVARSRYPNAEVLGVDTEAALRMPGVRAIHVVAEPGTRVRFAGQDIAAVAADTPERARAAADAIVVAYSELPFVVDTASAAAPQAPIVHDKAVKARSSEGDEPGDAKRSAGKDPTRGNTRPGQSGSRGDVDRALRRADTRHAALYTTPVITHSALETHGLVVRWDAEDRLTVWASTQGIFSVRDELAQALGLPASNVTVLTEYVGGGFGAKFGASAPGSRLGTMAAELARRAKAPVRLMCTRAEEHICTGNRPDARIDVTLGAKDGHLTAIDVTSHGSAGIGTGAGIGRVPLGLYAKVEAARMKSFDVFTHAGPGTAMRAPGRPQGVFALELAIDELAAKMGVDPLKLREQHNDHPVRAAQFARGRTLFDWNRKRETSAAARARNKRVRRGYGVAGSLWGDFGRAEAAVVTAVAHRDGTLEVRNGVQDIGVGIATVIRQVAGETLGVEPARIRLRYGSSEYGASVGSGGSQTTSSVTPAVRNACAKLQRKLSEVAAPLLQAPSATAVRWEAGAAHYEDRSLALAKVCARLPAEEVLVTATRGKTWTGGPHPYFGMTTSMIAGCQFAEVEVDTWTGIVRVPHVLAIHDCGRVMNPLTTTSQVQGGVLMGLGYALFEERVMDPASGHMLNPEFEHYKMTGMRDAPRIEVEFTEVHTAGNSTGAAGIGEPATIPTAAAIACALYDALGVPVRSLPLTPQRVLEALHSKGAS